MLKSLTTTALAAVAPTRGALGKRSLYCFLAALILVGASSLAPSAAHAELKPIFDQLRLYNSPVTLPTIEVEAEGQDCTSRFPGGGKRRWGEFSFELPKTYLNSAVLACNQKKQSGANTDGTHTTYVRLGFKLFVGAARVGNPATKLEHVQAFPIPGESPKSRETVRVLCSFGNGGGLWRELTAKTCVIV